MPRLIAVACLILPLAACGSGEARFAARDYPYGPSRSFDAEDFDPLPEMAMVQPVAPRLRDLMEYNEGGGMDLEDAYQ
jgi:hypothetical protein